MFTWLAVLAFTWANIYDSVYITSCGITRGTLIHCHPGIKSQGKKTMTKELQLGGDVVMTILSTNMEDGLRQQLADAARERDEALVIIAGGAAVKQAGGPGDEERMRGPSGEQQTRGYRV